jgi:hypothetical protein
MVADDNVTLVKSQSVAVVRPMPSGVSLPPDRDYLRLDHRVRALSELGWGFFRQRLALSGTRFTTDIEKLIEIGAATWAESELEAEWLSKGGTNDGFQRWLDAYDPSLNFMSRRAALDGGKKHAVRDSLNAHLIAPS